MKKTFEFIFITLLVLGAGVTFFGIIDHNARTIILGYGFCGGALIALVPAVWLKARSTQRKGAITHNSI
jgi:hypothetical protein